MGRDEVSRLPTARSVKLGREQEGVCWRSHLSVALEGAGGCLLGESLISCAGGSRRVSAGGVTYRLPWLAWWFLYSPPGFSHMNFLPCPQSLSAHLKPLSLLKQPQSWFFLLSGWPGNICLSSLMATDAQSRWRDKIKIWARIIGYNSISL